MNKRRKRLIVVGDRVLVTPEKGEERTRVGLYLPQAAIDKAAVQGGRIVEVGPGMPIPSPTEMTDEPWKRHETRAQYVPMEARAGDFALFLRGAAVEIEFEGQKYLIVPQSAILILVRESGDREEADEDEAGC
jgi:chaperonin GroES